MSERMTFSELFDASTGTDGFFSFLDFNSPGTLPEYFLDDLTILDYGVWSYAFGRELGTMYYMMDKSGVPIDDIKLNLATETVYIYRKSWDSIYAALTANYNPINNYSMTESGTDTRTNTGTQSTSGTQSGTETETPNLTTTATGENNSSGGLYGFNSTASVPSDTTQGTNTNTNTQTGTVNTETGGTSSSTRTDDLTEKNIHTFERSGNIGVTTSQQMIESELELRKKQFYSIVYKDIVNHLCLSVY